MNIERRSFLPVLMSVFSGFLAWFGRKRGVALGSPIEGIKPVGGPIDLNFEGPRRKGRWLNESDGCGGGSCRPLDEMDQLVRFVPVSERPPEITESPREGLFLSKRLLGVREKGTIIAVIYVKDGDIGEFRTCVSGEVMKPVDITHWAKMPLTPFVKNEA